MTPYCAKVVANLHQNTGRELGDITVAIFVIMAISIFIIFSPALLWSTWGLWCSHCLLEGIWQIVHDNDRRAEHKFKKKNAEWITFLLFPNTTYFIQHMNIADWCRAGTAKIVWIIIMHMHICLMEFVCPRSSWVLSALVVDSNLACLTK